MQDKGFSDTTPQSPQTASLYIEVMQNKSVRKACSVGHDLTFR